MLLKDKIKEDPGFQYVTDNLELMSSAGRRQMLEQPLLSNPDTLNAELDRIALVCNLLRDDTAGSSIAVIRHKLMALHDIGGTLLNLHNRATLDEIELFEIKTFAMLCTEADTAAARIGLAPTLSIPNLDAVVALLDPDHTGMANFYIYDSYHPQLGPLRKQLKARQAYLDAHQQELDDDALAALNGEISDLFTQQNDLQQEVIAQLSVQLQPHHAHLQQALSQMAYTDLLLAKATQALSWHLCRPTFNCTSTSYAALFNPRLRHRNEAMHLRYQPVDITLQPGVCLITGANMAGKTVLLKTAGTAQLMAQFGMFVPAAEAAVALVDDVVYCIGDEQNEMNGLSSFASEIIHISQTLQRSVGEKLLILIDEPARTTNPVEGKAIVQAIGNILEGRNSFTLITTHYSQLGLSCRRLRVRGFVENMASEPLTPANINRFMDYSLLPDNSDEVPQEALRIATILGCDEEMIAKAKSLM